MNELNKADIAISFAVIIALDMELRKKTEQKKKTNSSLVVRYWNQLAQLNFEDFLNTPEFESIRRVELSEAYSLINK